MKKMTDKLEELYTGEKQQLLLEEEMVEMIEEPLPPGEPAGAPEKDPITGEDKEEEEEDSSRAYTAKVVTPKGGSTSQDLTVESEEI